MKRITSIFAVLMLICLTACGKDNPSAVTDGANVYKPSEPEKVYTAQEVEAAIADAVGEGYYCDTEINAENAQYTFFADLDFSKFKSYTIKVYHDDTVKLDTTAVLVCEDDYVETAVDKLNFFLAASYRYVKNYPFAKTSLAKIENARLFRHANTVMLILGGSDSDDSVPEEEKVRHVLEEYYRIDDALQKLYGVPHKNITDIDGAFKKYYPTESL